MAQAVTGSLLVAAHFKGAGTQWRLEAGDKSATELSAENAYI